MTAMIPVNSAVTPPGPGDDVLPVLTAVIGVPGARRSLLARTLAAQADDLMLLSLNRRRTRLWTAGVECRASRDAVSALHATLDRQLAAGRSVVVDDTHLSGEHRKALLRIAIRHRASTLAVISLYEGDGPERKELVNTAKALPSEGWGAVVIAR